MGVTVSVTPMGYDPSNSMTLSFPNSILGEVIMEKLNDPSRRMLLAAGFPVITAGLMMVSTIVFFATPPETIERFGTVALDDFSLPDLVLTTMIRPFLYTEFGVFLANMFFLWTLGAALEPCLGRQRILAAVILNSVIASLVSLNLQLTQIDVLATPINVLRCPPDGSAGAIAGLAGLLAWRSGFPRCPVNATLQRTSVFSYWWPISGPLLVGFFTFRDFDGMAIPADCWGHAGGFVGGLMLALVFKLQDKNPDDNHPRVTCPLKRKMARSA
jgi:membrane associated rhomboid family serine protease